jgi:hypothetical protein
MHNGIAHTRHHCAAGLARDLAGFQRYRVLAVLKGFADLTQ